MKNLLLLNLVVSAFNTMPSVINIINFLRLYNLQNNTDYSNDHCCNSSEDSPEQSTSVPLFIISLINIVIFAVLCTLGGVTIFSE